MTWKIKNLKKITPKNIIFIEGLPGMGNVGKIAADFIIDQLKAEKVMEIYSDSFPHCVFVTENNMIELPILEIYQKVFKDRTLLFLAGDIQPTDERSCYEFCEMLLDLLEKNKIKEIITLGGIGQQKIPENPKLYCTGNDKILIKKYCSKKVSNKIHGVVGPIIGVTGLLLGLAQQRKIPAIAILSETFGHPGYLGAKGAREMLKVLNETLKLKLTLKDLDTEIDDIEKEIKTKVKELSKVSKIPKRVDTDYIG